MTIAVAAALLHPATSPAIFDSLTSIAVDRRNRIVILTTSGPPEGGGISQQLRRLLPDGSPDSEFGRYRQSAGTEPAPGPPGGRSFAVTTDARNRVIVVGSVQRHEGRFVPHGFLATRLNAAGRTQTWFGRDGAAKVTFGKHWVRPRFHPPPQRQALRRTAETP